MRLLGSGGMGAVYLAEDPDIGQQVAIKLVRTDTSDFLDAVCAAAAAEHFKQEARAVASLDHLHILPLYRYGEEETSSGKRAYIIMQYCPEGSLWDWLRRRAGPVQGVPIRMRPLFSLPTLAQTYKAPATHLDWENSSVPATTQTTPGSSYYPSQVSNSSGSALDSTVYTNVAQQDQFSPTPAWPLSQSHRPDVRPKDKPNQVSRRKALGWIAAGAAVAAIGGSTGIYLYARFAKPAHALYVLHGHSDAVTSVSWSPDGTRLLSGSRDSTVRLWLVANESAILSRITGIKRPY